MLVRKYHSPMNKWFNLFEDDFVTRDYHANCNKPAANIIEKEEAFELELAMPGIIKEDVNIKLEKDILNISVERKAEKKEEKKNFTRREFGFSNYSRSFSIPETVDVEKIDAKMENGVLVVSLPKKNEAKVKLQREIKVS